MVSFLVSRGRADDVVAFLSEDIPFVATRSIAEILANSGDGFRLNTAIPDILEPTFSPDVDMTTDLATRLANFFGSALKEEAVWVNHTLFLLEPLLGRFCLTQRALLRSIGPDRRSQHARTAISRVFLAGPGDILLRLRTRLPS
jgi:hypothetical protein